MVDLIFLFSLLIVALIIIILYLICSCSYNEKDTPAPTNDDYVSFNYQEQLNKMPSNNQIVNYRQVGFTQSNGNILLPAFHSPIEDITKHPIGTYSVYSLPLDIQNELLKNTPTVELTTYAFPPSFNASVGWPGLISEPMDQRDCGSCWSFATVVVFSDRLRIQYHYSELLRRFHFQSADDQKIYNVLNNISPYQLIFCDLCSNPTISKDVTPICNYGCSGGVIANAFDYLVKRGANTILATFPHAPDPNDPNSFICDFTLTQPVYRGKYKYIVTSPGEEEEFQEAKIKQDLFVNGPVSAAFTIYRSFYEFFEKNPTGIYTATAQPQGDPFIGGHAVSIVGWGIADDLKYWIIRNSWGLTWADGGFFKIQFNWRPPAGVELDPSGFPALSIMDEVWAIRV
jgi:hypothetical protein